MTSFLTLSVVTFVSCCVLVGGKAAFSETLKTLYNTVGPHIPEDSNCHSHCCKNVRSHVVKGIIL